MDLLVIPDGNRRWARERGRDYDFGYAQLPIVINKITNTLLGEGIDHLFFWCNSIDNLGRPPEQVRSYLGHYLEVLEHASIPSRLRVHLRGNLGLLPDDFKFRFFKLQSDTREHRGFDLYYFLNYDTLDDMRRASAMIDDPAKVGNIDAILANMDEPDNIDVIIRAGGINELSGFMPRKSPNVKIEFLPEFFPDLSPERIKEVMNRYRK